MVTSALSEPVSLNDSGKLVGVLLERRQRFNERSRCLEDLGSLGSLGLLRSVGNVLFDVSLVV